MKPFPEAKQLARMSISNIKSFIDSIGTDTENEKIIDLLRNDTRAGVKALARKLENKNLRKQNLYLKLEKMLELEKKIHAEGMKTIAGVDEAGRGPLAGPVVSACVILPENPELTGLDDSKKMTAKSREEMYVRITKSAVAWGIGMADNDEIDEIGILEATMKSMRRAVRNMGEKPDIVLIDGNKTPGLNFKERAIVNGDSISLSIAAASVIAKVTRDRIMTELDSMFPGYGFVRHKGYGASAHAAAIGKLGPCDIHRFSFKLVPSSAPPGTCSRILKKRLQNAPTVEMLERVATGIARVKNSLHKSDVEELRKIYKVCKKRFSGVL
ncbi:ribonuclease HII [Candidatus Latescibacterota bacterium]